MIIVPEWTTLLARSLGVGRGADLMNYLGWIGIAFVCIGLYSKLRVLESHLTELTESKPSNTPMHPERETKQWVLKVAGHETINTNRFPTIGQLSPSNLKQRAQDR